MHIITKKVRLIPAPFVGTRIKIAVDDPESLTWGMHNLTLAEGHERAIIDWGDGNRTELTESGEARHTYDVAGEYVVCISDDISALRCSAASSGSEFNAVFAKKIREFHTDANNLASLNNYCFQSAVNLCVFRCEGSGLCALRTRAFANCPSLSGRIDLPGVNDPAAYTFPDCPGITELQFSAANEAMIKALPAWEASNHNFGATNAVCKFDL